ncbi:type VI secretion protein TagU [Pseudomonas capeferrum]
MPVCQWQALMLVLFVLGGCNTNHVFDNGDYRPLGDPQSISRGQ